MNGLEIGIMIAALIYALTRVLRNVFRNSFLGLITIITDEINTGDHIKVKGKNETYEGIVIGYDFKNLKLCLENGKTAHISHEYIYDNDVIHYGEK